MLNALLPGTVTTTSASDAAKQGKLQFVLERGRFALTLLSRHRRAECPSAEEMTCRYCKQPGHMIKDCPDKPPMRCENCGEEGKGVSTE